MKKLKFLGMLFFDAIRHKQEKFTLNNGVLGIKLSTRSIDSVFQWIKR